MIQILDKYGNTSTDDGKVIIIDKYGDVKKTGGGGGGTWGSITGVITAQTDLITYLSTNYYPVTNPSGYLDSIAAGLLYYPLSSNPAGYLTSLSGAVLTSGSYSDPTWLTSLAWSKITGAPAFITGITSSDVTTALGYTPYNSTNPAGYISGITSGMVTTALGYTPVTNARTLTINGVTYDLTADRTWSITAGVSSVGATAPIASSGGSTPTISISQATTSTDGYLSSTDWNTFNGKQAAYTILSTLGALANSSGYLQNNGSGTLSWASLTVPTGANPTASVGLTTVNGVATTFMRSDAAPALSQSIAPTWTGLHTFSRSATASGAIARGTLMSPSLTAAANNDILVGLDVNPTFTNGAFTGVSNLGLRVTNSSNTQLQIGNNTTSQTFNIGRNNSNGYLVIDGGTNGNGYVWSQSGTQFAQLLSTGFGLGGGSPLSPIWTNTLKTAYQGLNSVFAANPTADSYFILRNTNDGKKIAFGHDGTGGMNFYSEITNVAFTSSNIVGKYFGTGNWFIGSSPTDAGFRLDVNGTARVQGALTATGSVTAASAIARGTYLNQTLTAAANNDNLVGLDIAPTFTTGAFTGTNLYGVRSNQSVQILNNAAPANQGASLFVAGGFNSSTQNGVKIHWWSDPMGQIQSYNAGSLAPLTISASVIRLSSNTAQSATIWGESNAIVGSGNFGTTGNINAGQYVKVGYTTLSGGLRAAADITGSGIVNNDLILYSNTLRDIWYSSDVNHRFGKLSGSTWTPYMLINSSGNVMVGTTTDAASAILQVASTTKGFLPPKMTTTQRDAITSPAAGLMIYDTTVNKVSVYNGTTWKYLLYE